MANAIIRHAVKDNAWFIANAAFVLQLGRIVFKSGTLTFVRGDGVTALSALPIYNCIPGDRYKTASITSNTIIPNGTLTFAVDADLSYTVNQDVIVSFDANNYMNGHVLSYSGTTLVIDVQHKAGSGTYSNWVINLDGLPVTNTDTLEDVRARGNTISGTINGAAAILNLNDTVPGVPSFSINTSAANLYINDTQFFAGDTNQNVGVYANIAAESLGFYNNAGSLTLNADGTISAGSNKVVSVANGTDANDAVNKSQLDLYLQAPTNYTPVFTGVTSQPTISAGDAQYFRRSPYLCKVRVRYLTGSPRTATTITVTLPFVSANTPNTQIFNCLVQNNGTVQPSPGRMDIAPNSNIATVYVTNAQGLFSGTGNALVNFDIEYYTAP